MCERVKGGERVRDKGREWGIEVLGQGRGVDIHRKMPIYMCERVKGVRG